MIGSLPIADITFAHVVKVLEPICATKTETASRLRGRIQAVLDWAMVSGYRRRDECNPAVWVGNLDKVLPRPSKVREVEHHAALPWARARHDENEEATERCFEPDHFESVSVSS